MAAKREVSIDDLSHEGSKIRVLHSGRNSPQLQHPIGFQNYRIPETFHNNSGLKIAVIDFFLKSIKFIIIIN